MCFCLVLVIRNIIHLFYCLISKIYFGCRLVNIGIFSIIIQCGILQFLFVLDTEFFGFNAVIGVRIYSFRF